MRALVSAVLVTFVAAVAAHASPTVVTTVIAADGNLPFCSEGEQMAETDGCTKPEAEYAEGRWARRHTHVGIPYVQEVPPVHGWGVPPGVYEVVVPENAQDATLDATVAFGWDQSVPGGAANDVELHLWSDEDRTVLVATTMNRAPYGGFGVSPLDLVVTPLEPGTYYLQEDVAAGEHTWWLTNASLTYTVAG